VIRSRRTRWTGHIAGMGDNEHNMLVAKPGGKRPREDLRVDGRIIL